MDTIESLNFKINYTSKNGSSLNGFVVPLLNEKKINCIDLNLDFESRNIFINNIFGGQEKGFYTHETKTAIVICISGNIEILYYKEPDLLAELSLENSNDYYRGVIIYPCVKFKFRNSTNANAILLHICNEPWS